MSDTAGFIIYNVVYSLVQVLPMAGYSVHGYRLWCGKNLTHGLPILNPTCSPELPKLF